MSLKRKEVLMIIAGYDVLAYQSRNLENLNYIWNCLKKAKQEGVTDIVCIGGATNPDHPNKTEAEANQRLIRQKLKNEALRSFYSEPGGSFSIFTIGKGDTSKDALKAAKDFIIDTYCWDTLKKFPKIVVCAENTRLAGFLADAIHVGLLDFFEETVAVGIHFPEIDTSFGVERKKFLWRILSHKNFIFDWLRIKKQKRHQRRIAAKKRSESCFD